jgi:hypothetical protein
MKIKAIIEVAGFPKEHVDETIIKVVDKLKEDFQVNKQEIYETIPLKDKMEGFWSAFCDIEISFKKVDDLTNFCFEFMPSSIEVLDPEELKFNNVEFANVFNDLLARLHHYDMMLKNLNASNQLMKKKIDESNPS